MTLSGALSEVSRNARDYPAHLLREGGTALCLFAARFYGVNDAVHMARNRMDMTLVDVSPRVMEMAEMYGATPWCGDAWEYAEWASDVKKKWDAVSVDCYTGDANRRALDDLELWCSLAKDVVTVTHVNGMSYKVPDGWKDGLFERNSKGGVNWLVLTRA